MCAVTREVRPVDELLRFVVGPDGDVVADLKRRLPGRGLWISASRETVAEAVRRGVFGRGFKRDVRLAPDFVAAIETMLVRAITDALAMAGKAREVVAGFTKVEAALRGGQAIALLHAIDGSADGVRKLDAIVRQTGQSAGGIPVFTLLESEQLDLALGRSNVIHAALRAGAAADTVVARCRGLIRFRDRSDRRGASGGSGAKAVGPETGRESAGAPVQTLPDNDSLGMPASGITPADKEAPATGVSRHGDA